MVDHISVREAVANTLRNVSLHVFTPSEAANTHIDDSFRSTIRAIGVDPDDSQQVWPRYPFHTNHFSLDETHAGNPLDLFLLAVSIGLILSKPRPDVERRTLLFALGIILSFLFFCTLLRWQLWGSRHHLPLFVLGSALIGLVLARYFSPKKGTAVGILLIAYALPFAAVNRTRSLVPWNRVQSVYHPRSVLYFSDTHQQVAATNIAAAEAVDRLGCNDIAIDSYVEEPSSKLKGGVRSFFVYPLLALIHADGRTRKVWYTGVQNLSSRYTEPKNHPAPCAVICLDCTRISEKWEEYQKSGMHGSAFDYIVVFVAGD